MMKNTEKVIAAIQQAAFSTKHNYKNVLNQRGEEDKKAGLKKNFNLYQNNSNDGFNVSIGNDVLQISYHLEMKNNEYHDKKDLEGEISDVLSKIKSYIKSEFKSSTGTSLGLRAVDGEDGELKIDVMPISAIRTQIKASQCFRIPQLSQETETKTKATKLSDLKMKREDFEQKDVTFKEKNGKQFH